MEEVFFWRAFFIHGRTLRKRAQSPQSRSKNKSSYYSYSIFAWGGIGVIICLFIDQLCFRFQLFDFQSHASPNLRILRISAPPQQLFVFIQAFLRRLFRELRVLVEIRRPFALQRGFYFVSRVGEERVDVSLERRPLLRGDDAKKRETRRFRRWWCSSKTRRRRRRRRPTASREEEEDARAQHGAVLVLRWSGEDTRAPPLFFSVKRDEKKGGEKSEHILRYSFCDWKGHDAHEAKSSPGRRRRRRRRRRNHQEGVEDDENDIPSNSRGLSVFSSFLFRFRGTIIFNCMHVKKSPIKELKIATKKIRPNS